MKSIHNLLVECNGYLLNACDVPGTTPGTRDVKMKGQDSVSEEQVPSHHLGEAGGQTERRVGWSFCSEMCYRGWESIWNKHMLFLFHLFYLCVSKFLIRRPETWSTILMVSIVIVAHRKVCVYKVALIFLAWIPKGFFMSL